MRLNADILFENLQKQFPAELSGFHTSELNLRRPEFYVDSTKPLRENHLYLFPGDQFPRRLKAEKGAVLLCSSPPPMIGPFLDRVCLIRLKERTDPFALMNAVTAIFDRYGRWYEQLHQIVETTADLSEMTELTSTLFGNPVMVLDSEFRFVTTAGYPQESAPPVAIDETGGEKLSMNALNQFLSATDMKLEETDPLHFDILGHDVLSYNLFDSEEYAGSLTVEYRNRPYAPGDEPLIRLFAHYLMLAMKQHTQFLSSNHSILRNVFRSLLDEMPLDPEWRKKLDQMDLPARFRCVVVQPDDRFSKVPASYLCDQLESMFSGAVAFPYRGNLVSFLPDNVTVEALTERLGEQIDPDSMKVGIGSLFDDLTASRWYYLQSMTALENGAIFDPEGSFHTFEQYALEELIINAPNDQPLEMYFSEGLKRLFEHDENSATSYIETLQVYLQNNMNVTATADALYVHRSTLLERLSRIKKELGEDLSDPDVRLRLLILLKALDLQKAAFE